MKIGFVSMPLQGHLNPMIALARKVKARGHDVVFLGIEDAAATVKAAGIEFHAVAPQELPLGSNTKYYENLAKSRGMDIIRLFCENQQTLCRATLEHLPDAISSLGIQALAIDTIHYFVELAAIRLNIPYVHISVVLHLDQSGLTPPCQFPWMYEDTPEGRARNLASLAELGQFFPVLAKPAVEYAERYNLLIDWSVPGSTISKAAILSQIPKVLDFPKVECPPQFHYTGPFSDRDARISIPFPWERLNGKRLIYASLGTLVNGLEHVYRTIALACSSIPDTQLVFSIGDHIRTEDLGSLPNEAIVVPRIPQMRVLEVATLCITHGGANTVLESLSAGVPMVAIPIGLDQPGMAARITYHGVGEFIEEKRVTENALRALILRVLEDKSYKIRAVQMKDEFAVLGGTERAAAIVEESLHESFLAR